MIKNRYIHITDGWPGLQQRGQHALLLTMISWVIIWLKGFDQKGHQLDKLQYHWQRQEEPRVRKDVLPIVLEYQCSQSLVLPVCMYACT